MGDNNAMIYRGYRFQMLDHNWLAGHEAFRLLPIQDHGVFLNLLLQVGRTRQQTGADDGSIMVGAEKRAKKTTVAKWLGALTGFSTQAATASLDRLRDAGLILVSRAGIVTMSYWRDMQAAPPSYEAERKRKSRESRARDVFFMILSDRRGQYVSRSWILETLKSRVNGGRKFAEEFLKRSVADGFLRVVDEDSYCVEMVGNPCNNGDSVPPAPPSISSFEGRDQPHPEGVTSHESQIEKDMNISSKGRNPSIRGISTGGAGGTESFSSAHVPPGNLPVTKEQIYAMSPLDCCQILVGAKGRYDQNSFCKQLREMKARFGEEDGTAKFRSCLVSLWDDLSNPSAKNPIRNRAAVLNSKINAILDKIPEGRR